MRNLRIRIGKRCIEGAHRESFSLNRGTPVENLEIATVSEKSSDAGKFHWNKTRENTVRAHSS